MLDEDDDGMEIELDIVKETINKLKLITQQEDLELVMDYYKNGPDRVDGLFQEVVHSQKELEEVDEIYKKKYEL